MSNIKHETEDQFIFLPDAGGIKEGWYSRQQFVGLMRRYKDQPDTIHFLADMLEE